MKNIIRQSLNILILGVFLISLTSCPGDDDDEPSIIECPNKFCSEPQVINNGLEITVLGNELAVPTARYTLLFKVDEKNGNKNIPIVDLHIDSIQFTDNGEMQSEFESDDDLKPDPGNFAFDVLLLVDLSGSITKANALPTLKNAMSTFVKTINPKTGPNSGETKIGIYYFDGDPDIVELKDFTSDTSELLQCIKTIDSTLNRDKSTNLNGAIILGADKIINRTNNSNKLANVGTLIVFTDGKDRAGLKNESEAILSINNLKANKRLINVYTIGLGGDLDQQSLIKLGVDGFYFAHDIGNLIPTFGKIANDLNLEVNSYYKLEYCTPRRANQVKLNIKVSYNSKISNISVCLNGDCIKDDCR